MKAFAKGRVERVAGIFQDRLVSELRLAGACTMAKANTVLEDFLPRFNHRFGLDAASPESAYRSVPQHLDLSGILCFKHRRKVARDNTVKYGVRTLQLLPGMDRPTYAGSHVEIQERLDGSLSVIWEGHPVEAQDAPPRGGKLRNLNSKTAPQVVQAGLRHDPSADQTSAHRLADAPTGYARRRFVDGSTPRQPGAFPQHAYPVSATIYKM